MTIDEILEQFASLSDGFPHNAVAAAEAQAEAITPRLLKILEEATENPSDVDQDDLLHVFAGFLLAKFREKKAYPYIVDMVTLPWRDVDALLGDGISEDLPNWLASVAHGELDHIDRLVRMEEANEYARAAGISAIVIMVVQGILERNVAIDYLRELFHSLVYNPQLNVFWVELVMAAADLSAKELEAEVTEIMNDEMFEFIIEERDAIEQRLYSDPVDQLDVLGDEPSYQLVTDIADEMSWWNMSWSPSWARPEFTREPPLMHLPEDVFRPTDLSAEPSQPVEIRSEQPGRNDPCPCGSGKKYKKCHGKKG